MYLAIISFSICISCQLNFSSSVDIFFFLQLPPLNNTKDGPVQVYKVNTDIGGYIQTRPSNSKDRIVDRLAGISQQDGLQKT